MINIEHTNIKNIPVLHVAEQSNWNEKLPLILFVHGFTSAKEHNLHYAYLMAEKGFRVVLPEAIYHGERNAGLNDANLQIHFWDIVMNTISELEVVKDALLEDGLVDEARIGVAGTSMGGIVTLGAMTQYKWIKAAVSLMGMPYYEKFALWQIDALKKNGVDIPLNEDEIQQLLGKIRELDISMQPEKLNKRPLLFWHGKKDTTVPYVHAYDFFETVKPLYDDTPEKIKFISDEQAGHKVSREGLIRTVQWFEDYI
ncbi:prolyl oligopeptidase family serine peptidase [Cytobacillus purgationiresistens]|uniref:Fermentation-respiration switch protein FrsA (DUF1100 family) n=1 Tax=Cytobacillus purgationiresistens TaxID=863449 RepID=A0ABU0ABZ0_9BACI|nr:prolyl oligopeptidase family serine peptidase [Cytobacillus purgationiresistens]MDQ0268771.1 fermentation-respiration switch protein FrsA (DUF1100 family) [Cytobacillus purgationiresistens]